MRRCGQREAHKMSGSAICRASAAPSLQLLRFTAHMFDIGIGRITGPLRSLASGAHVSGLLSKIDEPGNGHEQRAPNALCTPSVKGQTP
jgi:hypothetical protein